MRAFGQTSVAAGALVDVEVEKTPRGCQATRILKIEAPSGAITPAWIARLLGLDGLRDADWALYPARVKWFDRARGFGFVNPFAREGDVFIHVEVLQACGLSTLEVGEAVAVRMATGPRGRLCWEVRAWDHARKCASEQGLPPPAGLDMGAAPGDTEGSTGGPAAAAGDDGDGGGRPREGGTADERRTDQSADHRTDHPGAAPERPADAPRESGSSGCDESPCPA